MSDVKDHKLIITSTLANRTPMDLFLFRSYDPLFLETPDGRDPRDSIPSISGKKFEPLPIHNSDNNESSKAWYALRCSSAAPFFFQPKDYFMDGGLIGNNPTCDVMEELHRYNKSRKQAGLKEYKIEVLCSIGTGKKPIENVDPDDIVFPNFEWINAFKFSQAKKGLAAGKQVGQMLFRSLSHAEDYIVRRAEAWCEMTNINYFRCNTQLDRRVLLDEIDDEILQSMLWDAQQWTYQHKKELKEMADLLMRSDEIYRCKE